MTLLVLALAALGTLAIVITLIRHRESAADAPAEPSTDRVVKPTPPPGATRTNDQPQAPALGHALQPFSPIPLTVVNASPETVRALRKILDDENAYGRAHHEQVLEFLLTTNARVLEIDEFLAHWGAEYRAAVKAISEADPEWISAGELDRRDILEGACQSAIKQLDLRVIDLDYRSISEPPELPATADDEMLARYGFASLSFYLRHAEDLARVRSVPSDDYYYRPRFEALVSKGLAKRGADVAVEGVLQTLTLKEMETLAEGVEHKRFTRRSPAIEFLVTLPDLRERLSRRVSLRGLFQLSPLPEQFSHLDLPTVARAWAYADEYAKLLQVTYTTAKNAHREVTNASSDGHTGGWQVDMSYGDEACCPACASQAGRRASARNIPRLPHHVGCRCHLSRPSD